MQNELIENFTTSGQASYEAIQKLGAINTKTLQKLADIQFSLATMGVEGSIEQMKLINDTRSYSDLISAESDLVSNYGSKVVEITREAADILTESQDEISEWAKSSLSVANETKVAKKPAKKPAKRAAKKA